MKRCIRYSVALASLMPAVLCGAEPRPAPKEEKGPMRVLSGPDGPPRRPLPREAERREKVEMETVAFLGVETAPVTATTAAQLGLQRGTGLVVNHVIADSPAAGVLQPHDILLKLDDQILIETRQLAVLIRGHKEGEEVTLTYLRAGQKATARVKLGRTEVPKTAGMFGAGAPLRSMPLRDRFEYVYPPFESGDERADVDRVLSMIKRPPSGEPVRVQIDRQAGPGFRALAINTANSNLVFSDDDGSLELTMNDGAKTLVARTAKGEELFNGPVNSPEERKALPPEVRGRLERLESMHDITFRTDGEFKGAELRFFTPRGISVPAAPRAAIPPPPFY